MEPWVSGLFTLIVSGGIAYATARITERQKAESAATVAKINSEAEVRDSYTNFAKTTADITKDMLAPMATQLKTITNENLTLQNLIAQLRTDNDTLRVEQQRLKQVEANQRQKIDAQAKEIDHLKARLSSLEKLDIQRQEEIRQFKNENEKLQAKVAQITALLVDTGKLGKE